MSGCFFGPRSVPFSRAWEPRNQEVTLQRTALPPYALVIGDSRASPFYRTTRKMPWWKFYSETTIQRQFLTYKWMFMVMMSSTIRRSTADILMPSAAFLYPQSYLILLLPSILLSHSSTPSPMWSADVIAPPVAINSWTQTAPLRSALKETACSK